MTIIEKVTKLLNARKGKVMLKEIYERLPEHTPSSIRGNINRYLRENPEPAFERVGKGVYSVVEIINVSPNGIDYVVSYYTDTNEMHMYHSGANIDTDIDSGLYVHKEDFHTVEDLENHMKSLRGVFQSGDAVEIMKRYKDACFDCLICDPPYRTISGGTGGKNAPRGMLSKNDGKIFDYNDVEAKDWLKEAYRLLKEGSHAYIFTNFLNLQGMMEAIQSVGFKLHNLLVWLKNNATPNRWYMKNCEYVLLARKGKAKSINNCGSMTVHQFDNIIGNKLHETEKPVDLLKSYILNSTNENEWVLDPFAGSGSTAVAALETHRKFVTFEIDPKYIGTIHSRLSNALNTENLLNLAG